MIEEEKSKKPSDYYIGIGLCCGIFIGTLIGVRTDNLGVWISLGTVFGLVFGVAWQQYANKKASKNQQLPPKN